MLPETYSLKKYFYKPYCKSIFFPCLSQCMSHGMEVQTSNLNYTYVLRKM